MKQDEKIKEKKKNAKERKQFFKELYQNCSQEDVYSVIDTAEEMGIDYELVETWAKKNKKLNRILQDCRKLCADHARRDYEDQNDAKNWLALHKYIMENDDEFAREVTEAKAKEEAEREAEWEAQRAAEKAKEDEKKEVRKTVRLNLQAQSKLPKSSANTQNSDALPTLTENEKREIRWHEQKKIAEEQRLLTLREKQAKELKGFHLKKNKEESCDDTIQLDPVFDDSNLTEQERTDVITAALCAATGTGSYDAGFEILKYSVISVPRQNSQNIPSSITATHDALIAMAPADIFEGMLCSRLWALQSQSMIYMSKAAHTDANNATIDLNVNRATKLMRVFNETFDTLNKYRRKGEQKVVVQHQHVNVNDGGQAVVAGQFVPQGGGHVKKEKE